MCNHAVRSVHRRWLYASQWSMQSAPVHTPRCIIHAKGWPYKCHASQVAKESLSFLMLTSNVGRLLAKWNARRCQACQTTHVHDDVTLLPADEDHPRRKRVLRAILRSQDPLALRPLLHASAACIVRQSNVGARQGQCWPNNTLRLGSPDAELFTKKGYEMILIPPYYFHNKTLIYSTFVRETMKCLLSKGTIKHSFAKNIDDWF